MSEEDTHRSSAARVDSAYNADAKRGDHDLESGIQDDLTPELESREGEVSPGDEGGGESSDSQHRTARLAKQRDTERYRRLAEDVEACVRDAAVLRQTLSKLRERWLRGEAVQEDLSGVLSRHTPLQRLTRWAAKDRLDRDLEAAIEVEALDADTRRAFADLWQAIDWIVPGYAAFERERTERGRYWTHAGLDSEVIDGQVIIEHTFQWGVDEVHSIRAPAEKLFNESVQRLGAIVTHLYQTVEQGGDVSPETAVALCDNRKDLEQLLEVLINLEAAVDQAADEAESTAADTVEGGPSTEPDDLASLFGSLSDETDDEDGDGEGALIGIH